jgi:hypothetical protein
MKQLLEVEAHPHSQTRPGHLDFKLLFSRGRLRRPEITVFPHCRQGSKKGLWAFPAHFSSSWTLFRLGEVDMITDDDAFCPQGTDLRLSKVKRLTQGS